MPYVKTNWKNRSVEKPRTFTLKENPDGTITLIPSEGTVYEAGTPIVADTMNNIENAIEELYDSKITVSTTEPTNPKAGQLWIRI